jgi:hypothetical protein
MKPRTHVTLRAALSDEKLLGHTLAGPSWRAWRTVLIAAMGEPLTEDERALFQQLTGREQEPLQRVEEFVGIIGRRGGKSRAIAALSTYVASLCAHPALVRGERGVLLCIAADQRQADIILNLTRISAARRCCGSLSCVGRSVPCGSRITSISRCAQPITAGYAVPPTSLSFVMSLRFG